MIANGTIEATRLALDSLGAGDRTANPGSPRLGNLTAHLRSNITVRIRRAALGLPPGPPSDVETTAFLVRGQGSGGRQFHLQLSAAAVGGVDPERNMWQQLPDIDTLTQIRANQDPEWITIVLRCMGEMEGDQGIPPDPTRSWIDLSSETDEHQQRRAYVNLVSTAADEALWREMDEAAFDLCADLAGSPPPVGRPANLQYLQSPTGPFADSRPPPSPEGRMWWQDGLGTTHHEAGTLSMGIPGASVTDSEGRFHDLSERVRSRARDLSDARLGQPGPDRPGPRSAHGRAPRGGPHHDPATRVRTAVPRRGGLDAGGSSRMSPNDVAPRGVAGDRRRIRPLLLHQGAVR